MFHAIEKYELNFLNSINLKKKEEKQVMLRKTHLWENF